MSSDPHHSEVRVRALSARMQALIVVSLVVAGAAVVWAVKPQPTGKAADMDTAISSQSKRTRGLFYPSAAQWATLTVEPCQQKTFRSEYVTEGKIAVDEDRSTPIFSPYAGRVTKLFVKPGEIVKRGQPLFTVEATDMVQAQNDFISASTALNKARSTLNLAQINDKRQRLLYEGKAVPLKEVQQAQGALDAAENDVRSAEVALEASRNRLRILGKTDQEITEFQDQGHDQPGHAHLCPDRRDDRPAQGRARAICRHAAPATPFSSSAICRPSGWSPTSARPRRRWSRIGQPINFTVLAYPDRSFPAKISYVATALDPTTRRLLVRASVDNSAGVLKPEMFASVKILTGEGDTAIAVPRDAMIHEGERARVWVARDHIGDRTAPDQGRPDQRHAWWRYWTVLRPASG